MAERGVPAGVVMCLEVVEDGELGLAACGEAAAGLLVEQLALQGRDLLKRSAGTVGPAAAQGLSFNGS